MSDAVIGLLGVVVGGLMTSAKGVVAYFVEKRQNARYLAIRVACILDEYVNSCINVVQDDGTVCGQPAERTEGGEEYYWPQVKLPEPPQYPDDVKWKSIDSTLMYRILALPNTARDIDRGILASSDHASSPDNEELFEARHLGYIKLGLEALQLAKKLREEYGIPDKDYGDWGPESYLNEAKRKIEERRQAEAASVSEMNKTLWGGAVENQ